MKSIRAVFIAISLICLPALTVAAEFQVQQLTDNNSNDWNPSVYDSTIAWFGDAAGESQIYYWDGTTITQLTDDNTDKGPPSLYDGTVAWQAEMEYVTDWEIHYWDGDSVTQITDNNTDDAYASLYDGTVAWLGTDGHDHEVYYWDGNTIVNASDNDTYDYHPSLYDGTIAWSGTTGAQGQTSEIYYWDGNATTQVTDDNVRDVTPSLYDGTIAWEKDWQIAYWDGEKTIDISSSMAFNSSPSLYDGAIAWRGYDGNDWEIFYWDGTEVTQVTDDSVDAFTPALHNGTITWTAYDGNDYEIYYAQILAPAQVAPVADAGSDQSVWIHEVVTLDGSLSSDPDGDPLTFLWSFVSAPAGSAASLSDPTGVSTTFQVDFAGTYVVQLIVHDGTVNSDPATVTIIAENSAPTAQAGSDQNVFVNDKVILDGSGSSDPDGDPLHYYWSFLSVPEGSDAVIFEPTSVSPAFYVDLAGTYVVQLIVHDGTVDSDPAIVTITVENSPPEVDAGEDVYVASEDQGDTVLYGTAMDADGDPLTFRWLEGDTELVSWQDVEEEGQANLALFDVPLLSLGEHLFTLEVSDGQVTTSDTMTLIVENSAPQAVATGSGVYQVGDPVTVGGEVMDYDGDWLHYAWWVDDTLYAEGQVETVEEGEPVQLPEHDLWDLDVGAYTVTLQVSDEYNDPVSAQISVEMIDTQAPTLAPKADKSMLWPPNHRMVEVTIEANATDNSGDPITLDAWVSSSEPENGWGDGHTVSDWTEPSIDQDNGIITLGLRAERSRKGDGRVYTVAITATDAYGNAASAEVEILVPHDKGKGSHCRILMAKVRKINALFQSKFRRVRHESWTQSSKHKHLSGPSSRSVASQSHGGTSRNGWGVYLRPGQGMGHSGRQR